MSIINMYLFVLPTDGIGGAERVAKLLVSHLLTRRKRVVVLFLTRRKYSEWDDLQSEFEQLEIIYLNAKRQRLGIFKAFYFLGTKSFYTVYSTTVLINGYLSLLRRIRVLKCERLITRESTDVFKRFKGNERILASLLYKLYGSQDLMIYQTQEMKANLEFNIPRLKETPSLVIRNPISVSSISENAILSSDFVKKYECYKGVRFVFVGRLCAVKNPYLLIHALNVYRIKYNDRFKCAIIGNGELYSEIESLILNLDLGSHVTLLGRLSNPFPVMRWAEIGILTSSHEGFPNVINEMLCSGTSAVLSTNCVGGLDSIPSITVCNSFEASDIASSLNKLANDLGSRDDESKTLNIKSVNRYVRSIDISFYHDKVFRNFDARMIN